MNLIMSVLVSGLILAVTSPAHAVEDLSNELNSEINSFQVQLRPLRSVKKTQASKVVKRTSRSSVAHITSPQKTIVTKTTVQEVPVTRPLYASNNDTTDDSTLIYKRAGDFNERKNADFIRRFSIIPQMAFSTFDGNGSSSLIPQNTTDAMKYAISGNISTDLNILGSQTFFLEAGISYLQFGSGTGQNLINPATFQLNGYYDSLTQNYLGLSLNAKWLASGENESSIYVKGGAIPLFLMGSNYSNQGNYTLSNYRYGGVNSFDVALDLGVGYSFKVNTQFHVLVDITAYQGLLPILTNYNVYNAAVTTGLGVAYTL